MPAAEEAAAHAERAELRAVVESPPPAPGRKLTPPSPPSHATAAEEAAAHAERAELRDVVESCLPIPEGFWARQWSWTEIHDGANHFFSAFQCVIRRFLYPRMRRLQAHGGAGLAPHVAPAAGPITTYITHPPLHAQVQR